MTRLFNYFKWKPSKDQELLLKAALLKGSAAEKAWLEWSTKNNIYQIDFGTSRLIPLLYNNLKKEGINHSFQDHFKKIYIKAWANNRLLFENIAPLLSSFQKNNIKTLLIKGTPLIQLYYQDIGLRPMSDIDILVPRLDVYKAIQLLHKNGWNEKTISTEKLNNSYIQIRHAEEFQNHAKIELDLHWHLLKMCLSKDTDKEFWDGAIPIDFYGIPCWSLNPADNLFHICVHGAFPNKVSPIRWIADACTIIGSGVSIEWERILWQAQRLRLILPLRNLMQYLKEIFKASIPGDFLQNLDQIQVTNLEKKEFRIWNDNQVLPDNISQMVAFYPRIAEDTGRSRGIIDFLRYIRDFRELNNIWQIPISFFLEIIKRFFKKIKLGQSQ